MVRLANDALLAASCREAGVTLVTANVKEFALIRRYLRDFDYVNERAVLA